MPRRPRTPEEKLADNSRRKARTRAGLCGFCGKKRNRWAYLCDSCNKKHKARQRAKAMVECPHCLGDGRFEEDGEFIMCHVCFDEGILTAAAKRQATREGW